MPQRTDVLERSFPAEPAALRDIRRFVRGRAVAAQLGPGGADELTLAVSEAATNAIRHTETQRIRLVAIVEGDCVIVEVEDQGVFNNTLPVPEIDGPSGRGILLMTAFVDEVAIREGTAQEPGTIVTLVKCKRNSRGLR